MKEKYLLTVAIMAVVIGAAVVGIYWCSNSPNQLQLAELLQANETLASKIEVLESKIANATLIDNQLQLAELLQANEALASKIEVLESKIADAEIVDDQLRLQITQLLQANSALENDIANLLTLVNNPSRIMSIIAGDGFQYDLGTTGAILSTPSIPQFISSGSYSGTASSPSGFLHQGYLAVALSYERIATSAAFFTQSISYGTYEWNGKAAGIEDGRFMGWGFHKFYRQSTDGIEIYLDPVRDGWFLWNARNDVVTHTEIVGVDFSVEHKFTLEWTPTYIRLYIDDALVAQNQQNIPNIRLYPFQEIINTQIGTEDAYVFSKDWRKIA